MSSQFKDIAGYNLGPVGFQKPNHNATSKPFYQNQNATSRPFYQNRRNNFQKKPYAAYSNYAPHGNYNKNPNRDQSQSRLRKSEEGNWLGHPIQNEKNYQNSNEQLPHKKETPTQTVINGQSDEESKKLCLKIVGQIRKLKQDNDILSKNKEDLFKDREERSLRAIGSYGSQPRRSWLDVSICYDARQTYYYCQKIFDFDPETWSHNHTHRDHPSEHVSHTKIGKNYFFKNFEVS